MSSWDWKSIGLVVGMLISGSANTLSKKAQNDCTAVIDGQEVSFDHAWLQTATMFLGEFSCLAGYVLLKHRHRQERVSIDEGQVQLLLTPQRQEVKVKKSLKHRVCNLLFLFPASLDLLGTTIAGVGLIYTYASVWQMLRGSIVIFTAILSKLILKRSLKRYQYVGLFFTVTGLVLVGLSSVLSSSDSGRSSSEMLFGVVLIVLGQMCSAVQMVVEEKFLKKQGFHPMHVVGMEGLFGLSMMLAVVLPITTYAVPPPKTETDIENVFHDNVWDGFEMMSKNLKILMFGLIYLGSIGAYNVFGMSVAKKMTSVHRTLVDACRTLVVWGVDLFLHYAISNKFGESLTKWSILQAFGFVLLLTGTLIYNKIIRLCPSLYDTPDGTLQVQGLSTDSPVRGQHGSPAVARFGTPAKTSSQRQKIIIREDR